MRRAEFVTIVFVLALALVLGCTSWTFLEMGEASWYGSRFHGRKTANGETFDMRALTAAHKTLPFDTLVEVTNLSNQRKIIVRINDRGPFAKGRIIDLSYRAAKLLGFAVQGHTEVVLRTLSPRTKGGEHKK